MQERQEEIALVAKQARNDLISYAILIDKTYEPSWHHELIAERLMKLYHGEIKRLLIMMPPRHGKSRLISELFPSWVMGKSPYLEIILASYSESLAREFSGRARDIAADTVWKALWGQTLRTDKRGAGDWAIAGAPRGGMRAVGLNGAITGKGANIFIVDDPIRNRQDADSKGIRDTIWNNFRSAVSTRLKPNDKLVVVETCWHLDDLVGRIKTNYKEQGKEMSEDWEILVLPAIAPEDEEWELGEEKVGRKAGEALWEAHFPLKFLEEKKAELGVVEFSSLYQQAPINAETQLFSQNLFKYRTEKELDGREYQRFLTVDPAASIGARSDYTGFVDNRIDRDNYWNLIGWHKKVKPDELIDTLFSLHTVNRYDRIGIEETVFEMAIRPFLNQEMVRRNMFLPIVQLRHLHRSKFSRVSDLEARYRAGKVFHMEGRCADMEEELLSFPKGVNDDIVDAEAYQIQLTEDALNFDGGKFPNENLFDDEGFY